jgi:transcription elongation factor Elf1
MIVTCPSCATRTTFHNALRASGSVKITCRSCGHKWIEIDDDDYVTEASPYRPMIDARAKAETLAFGKSQIQDAEEVDHDVERLVEQARLADEAFFAKQQARTRTARNWGVYAALLVAALSGFTLFPETIVKAAPSAMRAYEAMGMSVNVYGLEIKGIKQQHAIINGVRVLTIKGEVVNVTGDMRKIPWLRFGLRDGGKAEVYDWTLNTEARPLRPGESTSFVTRVAAPPESARDVEIRFAREAEVAAKSAS